MNECFVGIDVSAAELAVCVASSGDARREAVFANDNEGHQRLIAAIRKVSTCARVCLEATGMYSLDAALALHEAGLEVMVANPWRTHSFARAQLQRGKTDKVDAAMLADFVQRMQFVAWVPPTPERLQLRAIVRRIHAHTKAMAAEKNRRDAADYSSTTPAVVMADVDDHIATLQERITRLEEAALQLIQASPDLAELHALLLTIKGVADKSSIRLLGELAVLPADMSVRQWVASAGLDPRPNSSGKYKGLTRISKLGNAHVRGALYMPALTAVRCLPEAAALHARLVKRGLTSRQATVAVMRKMLHGIWAVMHHRIPFEPARCFGMAKATTATA